MSTLNRWGRHALVATLAFMVAACGGGGDGAPAAPPASALRLDNAASVTQSIGPAGGTMTTTGADGTAYTLTVPAKALRSTTAITLTPIASIADLPSGVGLAGGAHLTPEGQTFSVPLKLTIALAAAPATPPLPFTYDGEFEQRHLYPATVSGSTIEFEIIHFSGYAAFIGQLEALQAALDVSLGFLPTPSARGDQALQELVNAATSGLSSDARAAAMGAALRGWLDDAIKPAVVAAQAIETYNPEVFLIGSVSQLYLELSGFDIALKYAVLSGAGSEIADVTLDFRVAVRDAARHVIAVSNAGCDTANALTIVAPEILSWQALAQRTSATALDPGLEHAAVLEALCVQVAYDPNGGLDFPTGIQPGQTGTLGVRAGYSVNGGPVQFDAPLFVLLSGATAVTPAGLLAPFAVDGGATLQQQFLWEPATTEMRIDVEACLAQEVLREVCQQAFIVRGTPPPVDTCPRYDVNVRGETDSSRNFFVNAEAGFSEDGAYGGASLGGNVSLSLTAGYPGTATARATMTYNVDASDAAGSSFDVVWRWSGNSNIGAGGSCTATLVLGGVSRSFTTTGSEFRNLELPMTVRHGDALQLTLDASCTSPGLTEPDTLVNANIGMALDTPNTVAGLRFNPVFCGP
jgi:hypothetical protein